MRTSSSSVALCPKSETLDLPVRDRKKSCATHFVAALCTALQRSCSTVATEVHPETSGVWEYCSTSWYNMCSYFQLISSTKMDNYQITQAPLNFCSIVSNDIHIICILEVKFNFPKAGILRRVCQLCH